MPGYQFAHVEMYARSPSALRGSRRADAGKKRMRGTGGWSARQVLAEALREVGACEHVQQPQQPEMLLGDLHELARDLDALELDPPKGQRKDTPILVAGVLSAPWPPDDPRGVEWRMDAVQWLRREFGSNLAAVVAHNDEAFDHMHFYVKAPNWLPVKPLHPGASARAKVAQEGGDGKAQRGAYEAAMRALQDRYHSEVGMHHGMARIGPARRRLTRSAWVQEQQQSEVLADARKQANLVRAEAAEALEAIAQERRHVQEEKAALELERLALAKEQARVQRLAAALSPVEEQRAMDRLYVIEQQQKQTAEAFAAVRAVADSTKKANAPIRQPDVGKKR